MSDVGATAATMSLWALAESLQGGDEVIGQFGRDAAGEMLVQAPGYVLDRCSFEGAVGHALCGYRSRRAGGSMPLDALSAKAREMVPVGAMDSRWLLRRLCFLRLP